MKLMMKRLRVGGGRVAAARRWLASAGPTIVRATAATSWDPLLQ